MRFEELEELLGEILEMHVRLSVIHRTLHGEIQGEAGGKLLQGDHLVGFRAGLAVPGEDADFVPGAGQSLGMITHHRFRTAHQGPEGAV
ncbi:MAG: hypothetical protein HC904_01685 [Blastochloris sp.]|nr:hypothetical protein [Blastochloris sp.]